MISLKAIRNHFHFNSFLNNVPSTFLISSSSSKFMYLSSISRRFFSRLAQSSHTVNEKILNSVEPLSSVFRSAICGGTNNEINRVVTESAQLNEKLRNLEEDTPRKLEEEVQSLSMTNREKSKTLQTEKKEKVSLSSLFSPKKNDQSKSKQRSGLKEKLESEPLDRIAYGVDPTVRKELSSDMKMLAEHLYEKGYFRNAILIPKDAFDPSLFEVSYTRELLKFAAMSFAKDRRDIAGGLSVDDLKTVALFGCTSTGRNAVKSAKHMREFFKINEQKVCLTCTLKRLCSRRDKSSGRPATELDMTSVMKVLVLYAMERVHPKLIVPEVVKNSISRLIKEVVSLSQGM